MRNAIFEFKCDQDRDYLAEVLSTVYEGCRIDINGFRFKGANNNAKGDFLSEFKDKSKVIVTVNSRLTPALMIQYTGYVSASPPYCGMFRREFDKFRTFVCSIMGESGEDALSIHKWQEPVTNYKDLLAIVDWIGLFVDCVYYFPIASTNTIYVSGYMDFLKSKETSFEITLTVNECCDTLLSPPPFDIRTGFAERNRMGDKSPVEVMEISKRWLHLTKGSIDSPRPPYITLHMLSKIIHDCLSLSVDYGL
jgi:hypothetical protein